MEDVLEILRRDVHAAPRGRVMEIAASSGVALRTLRAVIYGETKGMSYQNVRKLAAFYERHNPLQHGRAR